MANRYWVGGTASWDGTAGTKWALTSGGDGGEAVPTSSDDVFIDGNSGAVTVTITTGNTGCRNLDFTNFTGTLARDVAFSISGSLTFSSSMTVNSVGYTLTFNSTSSGNAIVTNGKRVCGGQLVFDGVGGQWTLNDNFESYNITLTRGTLTANNVNVSLSTFASTNSNTRALNMGSGTWTLSTSGTVWNVRTSTNFTLNAGTSIIKFTSISQDAFFEGGGLTYATLWFSAPSASKYYFIWKNAGTTSANNTFNTLKISPGCMVKFADGATQTVTTLDATGTLGNTITLVSQAGGTAFTLSKSSGIVSCNYLSVQDSTATGGAIWYAGSHSTNVSNNTGWIFQDYRFRPLPSFYQ
jgi:hypothetical protein